MHGGTVLVSMVIFTSMTWIKLSDFHSDNVHSESIVYLFIFFSKNESFPDTMTHEKKKKMEGIVELIFYNKLNVYWWNKIYT